MTDRVAFVRGVFVASLLAAGAYALSVTPQLKAIGPLTLALILGLAAGSLWRRSSAEGHLPAGETSGIAFSARSLLRIGVVLVGARLDAHLVARAGWRILVLDVAVVLSTLLVMHFLARKLGVPAPLATLLAVGTSVCGASAVAAAKDCARADDDDVAIGVALCGVVGTSAVLFYLGLHQFFPLDPALYGSFVGATIHEVAQVLAAAQPVAGAEEIATVTKLARVVLLPIVVVVLELVLHRKSHGKAAAASGSPKVPIVPHFVIGFVVVGVVNSLAPAFASAGLLKSIRHAVLLASTILMTIAMAAAGLQIHWATVRRVGRPAILAMVLGFAFLSALGFVLVRFAGLSA